MSDEVRILNEHGTRLGNVTLNGEKVDPWSIEIGQSLASPFTFVWIDGLRCYDTRVTMKHADDEFVVALTPPQSDEVDAAFAEFERGRR